MIVKCTVFTILAFFLAPPLASADCVVVDYNPDTGEPIVNCAQNNNTVTVDVCDPRITNDCYGNRNFDPRPFDNISPQARSRDKFGSQAGAQLPNAAGSTPLGAAGSTPRNAAGQTPGLSNFNR